MAKNSSLWITAALAVGVALLLLPWLPGERQNPLPEGPLRGERSLLRLWAAGTEFDQACRRGDLQAFYAAVTPEFAAELARQLAAVDQQLDAAALRAMSQRRDFELGEMLVQPLLAGEVRGRRAVVAVRRPAGDGAQLLAFVWDGKALRLDEFRRLSAAGTVGEANAAVVDAALRRPR